MTSRITAIVLLLSLGTWLVLVDRHSWFTAALGLFSFGFVLRLVTFDRLVFQSAPRSLLALGFRAMCVAWVAAAGCVLFGAFTSLPTAFAWIITPFLLMWISLWVWVLWRSGDSRFRWGLPKDGAV